MNRKKRRRRRILLFAALVLFLGIVTLLHFRFSPLVREYAENRIINAVSGAILNAITEEVRSGSVDLNAVVLFEKDAMGRILALRTNMREIAVLKAEVFEILDALVAQVQTLELGIPVGSIFLPELLADRGPKIPVRVISMTQSNADFYSSFQEAGINQTLQTISMVFSVDVTIFTPFGVQKIPVSSEIMIAQTVVMGEIPQSYVYLG